MAMAAARPSRPKGGASAGSPVCGDATERAGKARAGHLPEPGIAAQGECRDDTVVHREEDERTVEEPAPATQGRGELGELGGDSRARWMLSQVTCWSYPFNLRYEDPGTQGARMSRAVTCMKPSLPAILALLGQFLAAEPARGQEAGGFRRRPRKYHRGGGRELQGRRPARVALRQALPDTLDHPDPGGSARPRHLCRRPHAGQGGRRAADAVPALRRSRREGVCLPLGQQGCLQAPAARPPRDAGGPHRPGPDQRRASGRPRGGGAACPRLRACCYRNPKLVRASR